jgi:hypothetical protein
MVAKDLKLSNKFSLRRKSRQEKRTLQTSIPSETVPSKSIREQPDESAFKVSARPSYDQINPATHGNTESDPGPLGLNVVYTPQYGHKADIVFVHGLGGSSHWTWSKHRNPELFWPLTFLPLEPDLCLARILSFGYNANFRKSANASTVVLDFAKELLFDLKYGNDEHKDNLNIGAVSEMENITARL